MASITYLVDGVAQLLEFDATMSENHEATAEATEHDVERGADLTDHVRVNRPTISMDVMVTNHPVFVNGQTNAFKLVGFRQPVLLPLTKQDGLAGGSDAPQFEVTYKPLVYTGFELGPLTPPGLYNVARPRTEPGVTPGRYQANTHLQPIIIQPIVFANPRDQLIDMWETLRSIQDARQLVSVGTRLQDFDNMLITRITAPVTTVDAITFGLSFKQIGFAESLTFSEVDKVKVAVKKAEPKQDQGPKATYTDNRPGHQSALDQLAQRASGHRTPDEVLNGPR